MLRAENLVKTFAGPQATVRALDGVSLSSAEGELVAVEGPSGCGKTTLLLAVGGLLRPNVGRVLIDGRDPYQLPPDERAGFRAERIGFVFQQFHLVPYLSVLENVLVPALACPQPGAMDRARQLIGHFGLEQRAQHVPAELSVGERQRTALARALLGRPRLLLADEPTGNLDERSGEAVLAYLAEFADAGGAVLLVSHDPRAARYAHRILQMDDGKITST